MARIRLRLSRRTADLVLFHLGLGEGGEPEMEIRSGIAGCFQIFRLPCIRTPSTLGATTQPAEGDVLGRDGIRATIAAVSAMAAGAYRHAGGRCDLPSGERLPVRSKPFLLDLVIGLSGDHLVAATDFWLAECSELGTRCAEGPTNRLQNQSRFQRALFLPCPSSSVRVQSPGRNGVHIRPHGFIISALNAARDRSRFTVSDLYAVNLDHRHDQRRG